jgi:ABC-type uncharacterized transport system ATPase subunit
VSAAREHPPGAAPPALVLRGIAKRYGACVALARGELTVAAGTVHAVVGENGAGKSTLAKIAYGLVRADAGRIELDGVAVGPRWRVRDAIARGVGMVHQHFMLVGTLTVAENAMLGREPRRRGLIDRVRVERELAALAEKYHLEVDPLARVDELSVGEQQRVEILAVLWRGCRLLILDEPTAVLTPGEVRELFQVVRALVAGGVTVVIITHKLDEVVAIADRVTVLRRGAVAAELAGPDITAEAMARAMVGASPESSDPASPRSPGVRHLATPALTIRHLEVAGRGSDAALRGVSLEVGAGEIVGIAGVEGNGQTELAEAIAGLRRARKGEVSIGGLEVSGRAPAVRRRAGLGHVPEDRQARGLVLDMSVAENLALGEPGGFLLDRALIGARAERLIAAWDVRPPDAGAAVRELSGGNQQKVVLARELERGGLRALVCAHPTRGVDIAATAAIHRRLRAAREAGVGILLISAELSELRALCDRVAVLFRGALVAELDRDALAADDAFETLGALMTGARSGAEQARREAQR